MRLVNYGRIQKKCIEMGINARIDYEKKYQPEDNYHQLIEIYKSLLKGEA